MKNDFFPEEFMTKSFSFVFSVILSSLLVFSCADTSSSSSLSIEVPASLAREASVNDSDSADTGSSAAFTLLVTLSGDYSVTESFSFTEADFSSAESKNFTLEGLPANAEVTVRVSILCDGVAVYTQKSSASVRLSAGENAVSLTLKRGSSDVTLSTVKIDAVYANGSELTSSLDDTSASPQLDCTKVLFTCNHSFSGEVTYSWYLNGEKLSGATRSITIDLKKADGVNMAEGEENRLTCAVTDSSGKTVEPAEYVFLIKIEEEQGA